MYESKDVGPSTHTVSILNASVDDIVKNYHLLEGGQPINVESITQEERNDIANKLKAKYPKYHITIVKILTENEKQFIADTWNANEAYQQSEQAKIDKSELEFSGLTKREKILLDVILNHENRIRVLENKDTITIEQLKTALKANLQQYL